MSKLTGSDLIIKCLKMYDVDTIFGIAGITFYTYLIN
ncbi:MAG: hypothetical protein CM15mP91_2570 [Chloroflexota bacterium]|nr:MAG: hypothetical protein CM15mP91_2570 [Chloroflexota bacterium]